MKVPGQTKGKRAHNRTFDFSTTEPLTSLKVFLESSSLLALMLLLFFSSMWTEGFKDTGPVCSCQRCRNNQNLQSSVSLSFYIINLLTIQQLMMLGKRLLYIFTKEANSQTIYNTKTHTTTFSHVPSMSLDFPIIKYAI